MNSATTWKIGNICAEVWAATDMQLGDAAKKPEEPTSSKPEPVQAEPKPDDQPAD